MTSVTKWLLSVTTSPKRKISSTFSTQHGQTFCACHLKSSTSQNPLKNLLKFPITEQNNCVAFDLDIYLLVTTKYSVN